MNDNRIFVFFGSDTQQQAVCTGRTKVSLKGLVQRHYSHRVWVVITSLHRRNYFLPQSIEKCSLPLSYRVATVWRNSNKNTLKCTDNCESKESLLLFCRDCQTPGLSPLFWGCPRTKAKKGGRLTDQLLFTGMPFRFIIHQLKEGFSK